MSVFCYAVNMTDQEPVISLDGLTKRFGSHRAVNGVTLTVNKGEIFGFLGPNGAGKSTTIRMMLDVLRPTAGTATIFGVSSRKPRLAHRRLGYLSGDMVMDENLTADQYLRYVGARYGKDCTERRQELAEALKADLSVRLRDYSRGNRQKVGLIAALQHQPELLILDEPTSGFDPLVQETFAGLIGEFRNAGGTVFMSSHILSEVQQLCDRVAFIRDGSIVDTADISQLMARSAKHVSVKVDRAMLRPLRSQLERLKGINFLPEREEYAVTFSYAGPMPPLIRLLANFDVHDVSIREPELEELFVHYYRDGGAGKEAS